jgi:hypothetical protein
MNQGLQEGPSTPLRRCGLALLTVVCLVPPSFAASPLAETPRYPSLSRSGQSTATAPDPGSGEAGGFGKGIGRQTQGGLPVRTPAKCALEGWQGAPSAAPRWIESLVLQMAPKHQIDPGLVMAVIAVESNFQVRAVSPKQAQGLMQLIPETADRFGVRDPFDPKQNIRGGIQYLRWLLNHFAGDLTLALAGYNAGEKAVERHAGVPPYPETQRYVRLVTQRYGCLRMQSNPWRIAARRVRADGTPIFDSAPVETKHSRIDGRMTAAVGNRRIHLD